MVTGGNFPGGKALPGRDAEHLPPCTAEIKREKKLYLLPTKSASMERHGTTLPFLYRRQKQTEVLEKPAISIFSVVNSNKSEDTKF
jgi:hypothetical protein